MVTLDNEIALEIASHEAIVRQAYKDSEGIWTWSIGITSRSGHKVEPYIKKPQSMQKCVDAYIELLEKKYIPQVLKAFKDYSLTREQFAAAISFHWNTGKIGTATWVKNVRNGNMKKARDNFMLYKIPASIISRRKKEAALFFDGVWSNNGRVTEFTRLNKNSTPNFNSGKSRDLTEEFSNAFGHKTSPAPETKSGQGQVASKDRETDRDPSKNPASRILPTHRPAQSAAVTWATIQKFEHLLPADRKNDSVYVLAVRGYYTDTMGKKGINDRGLFDDAIFVVEPDAVHNFNGNTDPSRGKPGMAELMAPQVIRYKPGKHGISGSSPYDAFRQDSPCTVIRDGTGKDNDANKPDYFWINLHRGRPNSTSSAGCQTVPRHQWEEFKLLLYSLLDEYGQENFCYLIVDEADKVSQATIDAEKEANVSQLPTPVPPIPAPQGQSNQHAILTALVSALLANRGSSKPKQQQSETDILAVLLKLVAGNVTGATIPKPEQPINDALGKGIGNMLNGRKTAIGILGTLATILLPVLAPESSNAILSAFNLGGATPDTATAVAASAAKGTTFLSSIFAAMGSWGILGKIEKWIGK